MARITADSVIDDQLDEVFGAVERLAAMHEPTFGWCECEASPCQTFQELNRIKAAFDRRTQEGPT
jgi:hypothetical protein